MAHYTNDAGSNSVHTTLQNLATLVFGNIVHKPTKVHWFTIYKKNSKLKCNSSFGDLSATIEMALVTINVATFHCVSKIFNLSSEFIVILPQLIGYEYSNRTLMGPMMYHLLHVVILPLWKLCSDTFYINNCERVT